MTSRRKSVPSLRALGRSGPSAVETVGGVEHTRRTVFKHDFFAATALYEAPESRVVVKIGRRCDFLGLPLSWLGRLAAGHESALYARLSTIPGIPEYLGRITPDAFAHAFIPGHPLQRGESVSADFFPRLEALIEAVHSQNVAYVDLEKRENILVGDDGRPYLIDFQISVHMAEGRGPLRYLAKRFLGRLQQSDRYHLLKHWRRHRPDQLTAEQIAQARRRPIWIELHRRITRPLTLFRRRTLNRIDPQNTPKPT